MIALSSLWLPILLSAVFVFIASSIIHMLTPWHKGDLKRTPDETKVMEALRPFGLTPGDYMMPRCENHADMKNPEFADKMRKGPVMIYTVLPAGDMGIGKSLLLWFLFSVVLSGIVAWLAATALPVGTHYHRVFAVVGGTAFLGYAAAYWPFSIWWGRSWVSTLKNTIDGAIYAALTAGTFGWLWPRG